MSFTVNEWTRSAAVEIAAGIAGGEVSLLEGRIKLANLANSSLVEDWTDDEDFLVFGGIASEIDGCPIGKVREYWSPKALEREDKNLQEYENEVRPMVFAACKNILIRYRDNNDTTNT
jgi:hypothetical protein